MNYERKDSVGIDIPLEKIKNHIYNYVESRWGKVDAYGRVYSNPKNDIVVPEFYTENGNYKEVLMDDKRNAIFFFNVLPDIELIKGNYANAKVEIIFVVNLKKIKGYNERKDEEVRNEIISILKNRIYGFELTRITTTIDKVYNAFSGVSNILKNKDVGKFHHFKLLGNLSYYPKNCK